MRGLIRYERRTRNSTNTHFNKEGDWRPRLIVWPEYDGKTKDEYEKTGRELDDAVNEAWGRIIARVLHDFAQRLGLGCYAYELTWPTFWQRLVNEYALPRMILNDDLIPNADYINLRQYWGHDHHVFLLAPPTGKAALPRIVNGMVLDRANLLPYGTAIFDFGTEEAVLEISFADHEDVFLASLGEHAPHHDHSLQEAESAFISVWTIANQKQYPDHWREF